jgi:hypothetical protein
VPLCEQRILGRTVYTARLDETAQMATSAGSAFRWLPTWND